MKKVSSALALASVCLLAFTGVTPVLANSSEAAPLQQPQQRGIVVKGTVTDKSGEPITGANVILKGTQQGTITDIDGNFSLEVPGRASVLVVSFVGYEAQEISAATRGPVRITLLEDSELLEDVVVIGYGTQRKGDITSAVASVKSEDFAQGNINDAGDLIKGKVAGLTINTGSGDPSSSSSIRLRGVISLEGSSTHSSSSMVSRAASAPLLLKTSPVSMSSRMHLQPPSMVLVVQQV